VIAASTSHVRTATGVATAAATPPKVLHITNANGVSDYINERPYVDEADWCGEHRKVRQN